MVIASTMSVAIEFVFFIAFLRLRENDGFQVTINLICTTIVLHKIVSATDGLTGQTRSNLSGNEKIMDRRE